MNITIFIGGLDMGGAERVVSNLSNYFSKKHDVTIITMSCMPPSYNLSGNVRHVPLEQEPISKNFLIKKKKKMIDLYNVLKQE